MVSVARIDVNPPFVDPGQSVDVSAKLLNAVNRTQKAKVFYTVTDAEGTEVFSTASAPTAVDLTVQTSLADVELQPLDTSGLQRGSYQLTVSVLDEMDQPIPNAERHDHLLVGSSVTAQLSVDPEQLAPGTHIVNQSLSIETIPDSNDPFEILAVFPIDDPDSDNDLQGLPVQGVAADGDLIYVLGDGGIQTIDVSDPTAPQHRSLGRRSQT